MVCPPSLGALESRESADAYIVIETQFLFFLPLISTISFLKPMDKGPGKVGPCCLRPEISNKANVNGSNCSAGPRPLTSFCFYTVISKRPFLTVITTAW